MTEQAKLRHNEALYQITQDVLNREWMWDNNLYQAICQVVNATSPSHTIRSKKHSLLTLIRTYFDPKLEQWLEKNNMAVPWKFSDIVQKNYGEGYKYLVEFGMNGRSSDWMDSDDVSSMATLLIYFHNFCTAHTSDTVKKIYLDPKRRQSADQAPEREGKGLKIGARSNNKQLNVPIHLTGCRDWILKLGLCQACGAPTAAQIEYEVVTDPACKIEAPIRKKIAAGVEFTSQTKGSRFFCPAHSERDAGSDSYKKGREQIVHFLSLLLSLTFSGIAPHLNDLFSSDQDLAFAKKAIRSSACLPELNLITERMSLLRSGQLNAVASKMAKNEVVQAIRRMFFDHLGMTAITSDANP